MSTDSLILRVLLLCVAMDSVGGCIDSCAKTSGMTSYRRVFSEQELRAIVRNECGR